MRALSDQENYLCSVFGLTETGDLTSIRHAMAAADVDFMSLSPYEARILQFLVRGFGVRTVLEVGTLYGFSALCLAKALPPDGRVITLEKNQENWALAQKLLSASPEGRKVTPLLGDATETLMDAVKYGPFDMAFLDANKDGYTKVLDWAETHVRPGGLIVGDNTFLFGTVFDRKSSRDVSARAVAVMKEFNLRLADPERYNSIVIPTTSGLTVAQKRF